MQASIVRGPHGKKYIGDELDNCKSFANLNFQQPCDRVPSSVATVVVVLTPRQGYICDWGTTHTLWERGLGKPVLNVTTAHSSLPAPTAWYRSSRVTADYWSLSHPTAPQVYRAQWTASSSKTLASLPTVVLKAPPYPRPRVPVIIVLFQLQEWQRQMSQPHRDRR